MSFLIQFITIVLSALQWAILIRVLLSWLPMAGINVDSHNPVVKILYDITDPILNPLRKFATVGMMDLSPIIAFFAINMILRVLRTLAFY